MFEKILVGLVERLDRRLTRIVAQPLSAGPITLGEKGVHLFVGSPRPLATSGAGRWGYKVERDVQAYVVSGPTLRDPGGRDDAAVLAHLAEERSVVDAIMDFKNTPSDIGAIMVRWTAGGEIERHVKLNPGLMASSLNFTVTYAEDLTRGSPA